jgi:exopolysaccharide biosynthesis polyprenyl glycosylphosphotransferase
VKNLLFRGRAGASASRETAPWFWGNGNGHDGWFLAEEQFARALSLERRRVERSRKLLLLMLLDASSVLSGPEARDALSSILSTLSSSTRETDMRGWYKKSSIIGIIFTEIAEPEKSLIASAVLNRITNHLQNSLSEASAQRIAITLNFFPEDWVSRRPGSKANGESQPDLFRDGDSKKSARLLKRIVDVAGSSLALLVLAPLLGLIALLIKLTSKGPVFFRQERVGDRGRIFQCFKFRSMHAVNDPSIHKEYVRRLISGRRTSKSGPGEAGAVYKIKHDPRVTPFGRFLRRTSLDELPQFWNVLKGEMSLVGPRPAIPYEIESYDLWHRRRVLDVKPGITGLWQVCGRSRTTFDEMVRLDLRYAGSWSIWLDLKILLRTPRAVLSGEGAY